MRKKEKEITEKSDIESVIRQAVVCRLGLSDNNMPYIVPMCFGYMDDTIYLHSSYKGMKANIIRENPNVCFEIDTDVELVEAENACDYGMKYKSVIGFGNATFVENADEKEKALSIIILYPTQTCACFFSFFCSFTFTYNYI